MMNKSNENQVTNNGNESILKGIIRFALNFSWLERFIGILILFAIVILSLGEMTRACSIVYVSSYCYSYTSTLGNLILAISISLLFVLPIVPRLLIASIQSTVSRIRFVYYDLLTGGKSFFDTLKYSPIPTLFAFISGIIVQWKIFNSIFIYKFIDSLLSHNYLHTSLQQLSGQITNLELFIIISFEFFTTILYTIFFVFIIRELDRELTFIKKHNQDNDKSKSSTLPNSLPLIAYFFLLVLLVSDIIENLFILTILSSTKVFTTETRILPFASIIKFASLVVVLLLIYIIISSEEIYRYKFSESEYQPLNDNKILLMSQLCKLVYQGEENIRQNINQSSEIPNGKLNWEHFIHSHDESIIDEQKNEPNDKTKQNISDILDSKDVKEIEDFDVTEDIDEQFNYIKESTQGLIVNQVDKENNALRIFIAFRGTEVDVNDILLNLEFAQSLFTNQNNCGKKLRGVKVHKGFLLGYLLLEDQIRREILEILLLHSSDLEDQEIERIEINITGHSLGGALATIAAAKLHQWFDGKLRDCDNGLDFEDKNRSIPRIFKDETKRDDIKSLITTIAKQSKPLEQISKQQDTSEDKWNQLLAINLFSIGSPKVGNRRFKKYFGQIGTNHKTMVEFNYLRTRNDKEWAAFLPPVGFTHILPGLLWDTDHDPKYKTKKNRPMIVIIQTLSFVKKVAKYYISTRLKAFFLAQKVKSKFITKNLPEEMISDHHMIVHLDLLLDKLEKDEEDIYFEAVKSEYQDQFS